MFWDQIYEVLRCCMLRDVLVDVMQFFGRNKVPTTEIKQQQSLFGKQKLC